MRKNLSDKFGETSEALRKQRDEIEELHGRQLLEKDEARENLEKRAAIGSNESLTLPQERTGKPARGGLKTAPP